MPKKQKIRLTSWLQNGKPVFGVDDWKRGKWIPRRDDNKQILFFNRPADRDAYLGSSIKSQVGGCG